MPYYPYAVEKGAIYRLVGPDGSVAVFNDPLDPDYVGMLTDVAGLDSAEVRESATELTEADGGAHGYFYFSRRPVVLTASVFNHASVAARNLRVDRARRASNAMRGDATLSWKPSTRQENLTGNPGFEVDSEGVSYGASGTGGTGYSAGRTTTGPISGTASASYIWTPNASTVAGANMYVGFAHTTPGRRAIAVPNKTYSARIKVRVTAGVSPASLQSTLVFRGATNTYLGGYFMTANTGGTTVASPGIGTTYEFTTTQVAPAGTDYASFIVAMNGGLNTTQVSVQIDDVVIVEGALPAAYFDGDTAGMYWQGNPGISSSGDFVEMYTTLRRQQRFVENGAWVKELQIPMVSEYATLFSTGLRTMAGSPITADNRGSYIAYPIIEITGVSVNPRVTDSTGGDFRTTGLTLASGEKVEFDMLNHTGVFTAGARIGQSANRYIDFGLTKWVDIPGGPAAASTITLTSGGGTMSTRWRDVWA